jgi:serine/threonine protein kinase
LPLTAGTRLGPYEVVSAIGAGGMGEVYRARDTRIDRTVAIKVLAATPTRDLEAAGRFEREARALATLSHPRNRFLFNMLPEGDRAATTTTLHVMLNWTNGLAR